MAVQVVENKGSGILGNIGSLATLGGLVTGQPWLTALGTGMSTVDGMINPSGGGSSGADALAKLKDVIDGWKNPASGNIARTASKAAEAAKAVIPAMSYEELASRWSPYL